MLYKILRMKLKVNNFYSNNRGENRRARPTVHTEKRHTTTYLETPKARDSLVDLGVDRTILRRCNVKE